MKTEATAARACLTRLGRWVSAEAQTRLISSCERDPGSRRPRAAIDATEAEVFSVVMCGIRLWRVQGELNPSLQRDRLVS